MDVIEVFFGILDLRHVFEAAIQWMHTGSYIACDTETPRVVASPLRLEEEESSVTNTQERREKRHTHRQQKQQYYQHMNARAEERRSARATG
jgi:hypothetical protein